MRVLVACECSGRVRDAFIAKGHDAISCDLLPTESPGPHYQGDVRDILCEGFDMMVAHPVCKRLTNAGVRWLHIPPKGRTLDEMWEELDQASEFYNELRNAPIALKAIENPIMHKYAQERIGKPERHIVQPWWFGDEAFKATGFELIGLKPLTPTNKLDPPKTGTEEHKAWSFIHRMPPGPNREKERSRSFPGMCKAMAEQWG